MFFNRKAENTCLYKKKEIFENSTEEIQNDQYISKIENKPEKKNEIVNEGDMVLLKEDFDNNVKTKKLKLNMFNVGPFEVFRKIDNFTFIIKYNEKETKTVDIS